MKKQTKSTKISEVERAWHLVDAKDKILGRIATQIAESLMGKGKSYFVHNLDCGDYVVVINARYVKVTGKKETDKIYTRYSGYPGGIKKDTLRELRSRKPEEVIKHAVAGMLPKNRLHDRMLTRLFIFSAEKHSYDNKFVKK